jgi:protein-tyrosine phosphatase
MGALPRAQGLITAHKVLVIMNQSSGGKIRHDHQWVTERIALGSTISQPEHVKAILHDGITHVLDCTKLNPSQPLLAGTGIVYRQCGVPDDGQTKPDQWFFQGIDFVLQTLKSHRTKVLVHCALGFSRSPSMVFAILLALGDSPDEAVSRIKTARVMASVRYREDAERAIWRWRRRERRQKA